MEMNDQVADPELEKWRRTTSSLCDNMNFVGWATIISGALNCLSIVGAIFGIPYIFIGLRLTEAVKELRGYLQTGDKEAIFRTFEKQNRAFFIAKVLIIIGIVFFVLMMLFVLIIGLGAISEVGRGW